MCYTFLERIDNVNTLMQYYESFDLLIEDVNKMSYADLLEALMSGFLSEAMKEPSEISVFDTPLKAWLSELGRRMFHDENLTIDNIFEVSG